MRIIAITGCYNRSCTTNCCRLEGGKEGNKGDINVRPLRPPPPLSPSPPQSVRKLAIIGCCEHHLHIHQKEKRSVWKKNDNNNNNNNKNQTKKNSVSSLLTSDTPPPPQIVANNYRIESKQVSSQILHVVRCSCLNNVYIQFQFVDSPVRRCALTGLTVSQQ